MNRRFVVAATFLGIGACATSAPEPPVPDAGVETTVTSTNATAAAGEFEAVEVPEVPKMASNPAEARIPDQTEVVCRNEKRTGSHRLTRVCRRRSVIENTEAAAQKTFKEMLDIQRTQGEY